MSCNLMRMLGRAPRQDGRTGHQRRFGAVPTMSGLPLTADVETSVGDGRMAVSGSPPRFANDTKQRTMGHFYPSAQMLWRTNGTAECWFKPINLIEAPRRS